MLLYQMARLGGWKGPNFLSLMHLLKFDPKMANSKMTSSDFLYQAEGAPWGVMFSITAAKENSGGHTTANAENET